MRALGEDLISAEGAPPGQSLVLVWIIRRRRARADSRRTATRQLTSAADDSAVGVVSTTRGTGTVFVGVSRGPYAFAVAAEVHAVIKGTGSGAAHDVAGEVEDIRHGVFAVAGRRPISVPGLKSSRLTAQAEDLEYDSSVARLKQQSPD